MSRPPLWLCQNCKRPLGQGGGVVKLGQQVAPVVLVARRGDTEGVASMQHDGTTQRGAPLWACERCSRPLGRIINTELDVFGPSHVETGWLRVRCYSCGQDRRWELTCSQTHDSRPAAWSRSGPMQPTLEEMIGAMEERWEAFRLTKLRQRGTLAVGLRFDVFIRDNFRCRYCGVSVDNGAILHVDHVVPESKGGPTTMDNLVTACIDCNLGKSDKELPT